MSKPARRYLQEKWEELLNSPDRPQLMDSEVANRDCSHDIFTGAGAVMAVLINEPESFDDSRHRLNAVDAEMREFIRSADQQSAVTSESVQ